MREYNNSYNFFAGMSEDAVAQVPEGRHHRPSPDLEAGLARRPARRAPAISVRAGWAADDPFGLFGEGSRAPVMRGPTAEGRKILNAQRRALDVLGLEANAKRADIKARFKVLVKQHHPDANGGDRGSEDRLREIIVAYNYLKSAGFC